jgi:hypothetical protein
MAALTNFCENKLIDHLFRTTTYTPGTMYVGLFTAMPSDTGGGTEVTGGSYARVAVTKGDAYWNGTHGTTTGASSGTGGTTSNAGSISFPTPSANWGTIVGFGLFDASSAGNLLVYGALSVNKTVNNGDPAPMFQAGTLQITVDN